VIDVMTLDAQGLKARLDSETPPLLLDVTPEDRFNAVRIPGAKNACVYLMQFLDTVKEMAPNAVAPVVVYGSSRRSLASADAAEKLERAGYMNVADFRGGTGEWVEAGLPVEGEGAPPPSPSPEEREELTIDTEKSVVRWVGRNLAGRHAGTIAVSGGSITLMGGKVHGGHVVFDMTAIACDDIADGKLNGLLIAHLESDDFFDVAVHPQAEFTIESADPVGRATPGAPDVEIAGKLTLKGVSNPVRFLAASGRTDDGGWAAQATTGIDRTEWGVNYGSGKLYEFLGMHLVNDHITLEMTLVAN